MKNKLTILTLSFIFSLTSLIGCSSINTYYDEDSVLTEFENNLNKIDINEISRLEISENTPWITINNNIPYFTEKEKKSIESFEIYSDLDTLGRCGVAFANICKDLMPNEERGEIGSIKPSGWHTVKYNCVDGKYLYNRCHLIGFQLAGENANEKNLITGTRYLNIEGMLDFENQIADYVKETNNHVLYRVTPHFSDNNLLCDGVLMEGYSVEDKGEGIQFCVFAYNIQPNVNIDYLTGNSSLSENNQNKRKETINEETFNLILNTNSKKYHKTTCSAINKISDKNKENYNGTIYWLQSNGYNECNLCFK